MSRSSPRGQILLEPPGEALGGSALAAPSFSSFVCLTSTIVRREGSDTCKGVRCKISKSEYVPVRASWTIQIHLCFFVTAPLRLRILNCPESSLIHENSLIGCLVARGLCWTTNYCNRAQARGGYLGMRIPHHRLTLSSPRSIMSTAPSISTSHSNFLPIFNAALESYKRKTKTDLASHPFLPSIQSCDPPVAVLTVFREQFPAFSRSQNDNDNRNPTKWVTPTVNVLYSFSETMGLVVGLVSIEVLCRDEFLL